MFTLLRFILRGVFSSLLIYLGNTYCKEKHKEMVRKNTKPTFRNYLASARENKKDWEDYLNKTYPMESMTIEVGTYDDRIFFTIGKDIIRQNRVQFNQATAPDFYFANDDNFDNIINSIFDLSKLNNRDNLNKSMPAEALLGFAIIASEKVLYRDFKAKNNKQTGIPCIWELYHQSKTFRYGCLGFNAGATKFIKDQRLVQFATNDLINREHPLIDKIKAQENKVKKANDTITKQKEIVKKAKEQQEKLLSKL